MMVILTVLGETGVQELEIILKQKHSLFVYVQFEMYIRNSNAETKQKI